MQSQNEMALRHHLVKKLNGKFEPSATSQFRFRGKDVVVQTDAEGNALRAFVGKADENGIVKGDRYSRVRRQDDAGKLIKDHWERKGRAS